MINIIMCTNMKEVFFIKCINFNVRFYLNTFRDS